MKLMLLLKFFYQVKFNTSVLCVGRISERLFLALIEILPFHLQVETRL